MSDSENSEMTLDEAFRLIFTYSGVGRDIDDLKANTPTLPQLSKALAQMQIRGVSSVQVAKVREVLLAYYDT